MRRFCHCMLLVPLVWVTSVADVRAAPAFADPAFQQQWQQGEALTPNFWGPLANAKDGQQEPYKDAIGGTRLVQYFDKGRMELTNGAVTNGLLASEIMTGRIQTGDKTFEDRQVADIAVAGDPGGGPTYRQIGQRPEIIRQTPTQVGSFLHYGIDASGGLVLIGTGDANTTGDGPEGLQGARLTAYDAPTQHNVFSAFVVYRERAGLSTIGLAITEPFYAKVTVAGQQHFILIQGFERRLLTYTPSNPEAFKVEMGNIGQHYYQWRYGSPQVASQPAVTPIAATPAQVGIMLTGTSSRDIPASETKGATQDVHVEALRIDPGEQSHTVTLTNTTGGTLTFAVQIPAPFTVTPTSGSILSGQAISLSVGRGSATVGTASPMFIDVGANRITITVTA